MTQVVPGVGGSLGQGGTVTPLLLPLPELPPLLVLPLPVELLDDDVPPSYPGSRRPPHAVEVSPTSASTRTTHRTATVRER